ncbi:hypothetical protein CLPU_4c01700 [Gottschalkia purinilytica]|uniref:Uncharacterized protein n=1 Tax=Gottschalkia purinilytica TaxID=1503 RepID=A0A0L0WCB9_GOTPU|nr:hypothetical protein [Gottschalkia purinilytica]KNF09124.1 hypothetical protein CLPU_4c01700 [Gottschalkia purinilytica]
MQIQTFKIHGDNIVECERIFNFISRRINIIDINKQFISQASIQINVTFIYNKSKFQWRLIYHPGFNKSNRRRWNNNIFDSLKTAGSFLDETPDAIITQVSSEEQKEKILCAIEFCSALQAGNQAWQRSGRAYSTIRTGCPYLYIVDFVKYELDSTTRKRKAIRTPNPAIPYSYINNTRQENVFGAQAFVKSEEFDESNPLLKNFDESIFSEDDIADYLINLMLGYDTTKYEKSLLDKNLRMVNYFSIHTNGQYYFKPDDWKRIYKGETTVIELSKEKKWEFSKKIAGKSMSGKLSEFVKLSKKYAYGISCKDLPFGIVPATKKPNFIKELISLYPISQNDAQTILEDNQDLLICLIKGFKPRGDDNRPDRGLLPFLAMLTSEHARILTLIYGPMNATRIEQIKNNPSAVARVNGFWNVFLGLSDYLLLDVPILNEKGNATLFRTNRTYKQQCTALSAKEVIFSDVVSPIPNSIHEDDVDSTIHMLFTSLPSTKCFEGLCNPPGGDWSGLSVIVNQCEYRWVSLPRVSGEINGKRPDHVLQLNPYDDNSIILSIESKDRSFDLEPNVGTQLKQYIKYLSTFIPSCEKNLNGDWSISSRKISLNSCKIVSVAAFIDSGSEDYDHIHRLSACDLIFALSPKEIGWNIKIINYMPDNSVYTQLKELILSHPNNIGITCTFL